MICGMWNEICFQEKVIGAKDPAEMFILTQRRRERRVHTEEYFSHRNLILMVVCAKALA